MAIERVVTEVGGASGSGAARKKHIEWLSILRGLNILLVVMYHVELVDMSTGNNHSFCTLVSSPFTPLRIPLFIFISGGLLYLSRIRKDWSVKDLYIDKAQRILMPFVSFVFIYFAIKVLLDAFVKTPVKPSFGYFLESFVIFPGHPSAPLWFLATLSVLMFMYPLFCWLCRSNVRMVSFMLFCCVFYFVDYTGLADRNYFYLFTLNHYLVFFFSGIFFFRYRLYEYLNHFSVLAVTVAVYVFCYVFEVQLLVSFAGILMMCSFCLMLSRSIPWLFSSFSEYIYQIYLMSVIFQAFVELILWKRLFYNEYLFYLFYMMNVTAGIFFPVVVTKLIKRCPWRIVRLCFGLK